MIGVGEKVRVRETVKVRVTAARMSLTKQGHTGSAQFTRRLLPPLDWLVIFEDANCDEVALRLVYEIPGLTKSHLRPARHGYYPGLGVTIVGSC